MKKFIIICFTFFAFAVLAQEPSAESSSTGDAGATDTNRTERIRSKFLIEAGIQYAEEGEYEDAEMAYLRALEEDPDDAGIRFRLSTLYIYMERYQEAIDLLEGLSEEFPGNAQVHNNLSWIYSTTPGVRNGEKALRHARDAILIYPNSAPMWNTLAEAYYVSGDYERALRSSEHAIDLLQSQGASQERLLDFKRQLNRIIRAQEAYKQFFGIEEDN